MVTAIVLVRAEIQRIPEVAETIAQIPEVSEVYSVTGEFDLVAMVRVRVHEELADVIPGGLNKVPGVMITIVPDGFEDDQDALTKAAVILIKFRPGELHIPTRHQGSTLVGTMNWTVENIVAYSKICTHVGCPVALYEQTTHHILCPCHQSTFDAPTGATVIFGPAARPLPQLPMTTDAQGYLVARSDFTQPVGPSFWERG